MKITITGTTKEGKSTIAKYIKDCLENYNICATLKDEELSADWHHRNTLRMEWLSHNNLSVTIETVNIGPTTPKFDLDRAEALLNKNEIEDLRNGLKIACIKKIRGRTGCGLELAKNIVEEFEIV